MATTIATLSLVPFDAAGNTANVIPANRGLKSLPFLA
jgi:hypothetical protein